MIGSLRESVRRKEKDGHQLGRILANKRGEANDIREIDQRVDSPGKGDELLLPCGSDLAPYMIAHFMIGTVPTRGLIDCGVVPNVAKPLHKLLCKDAEFEWKSGQEEAFNTPREKLTKEPVQISAKTGIFR